MYVIGSYRPLLGHFKPGKPTNSQVGIVLLEKLALRSLNSSQVLVAHVCNSSYSEDKSGGWWFEASTGKKSSRDPISKNFSQK
jgi:hypothetical protein